MASIAEIRQQFPQYNDLSDQQLADALYGKFYSDMPRADFDKKIGLQPPPQGDIGDVISAGFTSGVNAIPFVGPQIMGGLNQVKAAVHGVPVGEIASENRQLEEQNPIASTIGSVAGPTLALAPLGMTSLGARALGLTGSIPSRIMAGGLSGAAIAGGDTAVRGGDPGQIATNALLGGSIGGAIPLASAGARSLLNNLTGRAVPKSVQNLSRAMSDDQIDPATANQKLADLGADAMVMDLAPNLQAQAGAIASVPGTGQQVVREAVQGRQAAAPQRVNQDVSQVFGSGPDVADLRTAIISGQKARAKPLYDAVRDVQVPVQQGNFAFVFQTPLGKQALASARQMAANDGYRGVDTIQIIDYAKQSLDDIAGEAIRQNKRNLARQASDLARILAREADKVAPGYKAAREAFAGPAKVADALDAGAETFAKDMTPGQLQNTLHSLSPSEQDAFIQGARGWIEGQMGNAVNEALALRNLFKRGWNEQKLRIVLGDDLANDLMKRINREAVFGKTANAVSGNSETARRQAAQAEIAPDLARSPRPEGMVGLVLSAFDKARMHLSGTRQPKINAQMAGLHTAKQLTPKQIGQLQRARLPAPPAWFAPAGVSTGILNGRRPVEITVRGADPLRN